MIKPEQIPDEVVEAHAWAACDEINGQGSWEDTPMRHRHAWRNSSRAGIAAAINAWPGAFPWTFNGPLSGTSYVLPVSQEKNDD